jgi:hypothetical protein
MPDPMAFISYKHELNSSRLAQRLKRQLTARGIQAWYDVELRGGEHWSAVIDSKIDNADFMIVIVTPASAQSLYVTYEWSLALGKGKHVIPLLLAGDETIVHPRMARMHHRDFRTQFEEQWELLFQDIDDILNNVPVMLTEETQPAAPTVVTRLPATAERPSLHERDKRQLREFFRIVPPQVVKDLTTNDFLNLSIYDLDETNTTFFVRIMEINDLMECRPHETLIDKRLAQLLAGVCDKILSLRLTPSNTEDSDLIDPDAFDQSRIALKEMKQAYTELRQYVRQTYQVDVSS